MEWGLGRSCKKNSLLSQRDSTVLGWGPPWESGGRAKMGKKTLRLGCNSAWKQVTAGRAAGTT